jgi:hypothetical protein
MKSLTGVYCFRVMNKPVLPPWAADMLLSRQTFIMSEVYVSAGLIMKRLRSERCLGRTEISKPARW